MRIMTAAQRLRRAKDVLGWRSPYHEHFRTIRNGVDLPLEPYLAPVYTINCSPADCEAPGCPRTVSGFPKAK